MPCPSHPPWLDHSNYTCTSITIYWLTHTATFTTDQFILHENLCNKIFQMNTSKTIGLFKMF
jgi:hypothetical protein